jgi:hypothetical protein
LKWWQGQHCSRARQGAYKWGWFRIRRMGKMLLDQTWREGKAVVGESLQKGQRRRARYAQVVHGKGLEDAPRD